MENPDPFRILSYMTISNIQFKWGGSVYECTEAWNKEFQTDYDYREFKANEFKWLIETGQFDLVEKRLHGLGEIKIDKKYYKKIK